METRHRVNPMFFLCVINLYCYSIIQPLVVDVSNDTHWWDCCYGSHPCQVLIADSSTIKLLDLKVLTNFRYMYRLPVSAIDTASEFCSAVDTALFIKPSLNQSFITTSDSSISQYYYYFRRFVAVGHA